MLPQRHAYRYACGAVGEVRGPRGVNAARKRHAGHGEFTSEVVKRKVSA